MTVLRLKHVVLLAAHLALGALVVLGIDGHRRERRTELEAVRQEAIAERARLESQQTDLAAREALRDGLRDDDPYAVELILRQRLGYTGGPDEVRPPPVPER